MLKRVRQRLGKALLSVTLSVSMLLGNCVVGFAAEQERATEATDGMNSGDFLKADGKVLRNNSGTGDVVYLRGTNAGGYLLQEFWMCLTKSTANVNDEIEIYNELTRRFGEETMLELVNYYQDQYWTETDFDNCADLGINCIRLPIWYRNLVDANGNDYEKGWERVDWFVEQASKRGIYVVLDMHGAPGSQNGSDHSGVDGGDAKEAASQFFWGENAAANQQLYYRLWEKLATRYKGNPAVAGYDLLNEPYCTYRYNSSKSESELHNLLWGIYDTAYDKIRAIDPDHVIIMEATWNPVDLPNPADYGWSNVMYEYHNYEYSDYNNAEGKQITSMQNKINSIKNANYNVPSYMGEFCYFDNPETWKTGVQLLNDAGLNWTTWTYKTVDSYGNWGLYHHASNDSYKVNIETDSVDTIKSKWANVKTSSANTSLINAIKPYFPGTVQHFETVAVENGEYYLSAVANDMIVCAENEGEEPLAANRESYSGAWETFTIVNNNDGTISLKSGANNKYVCAVIDEENQLLARSETIGTWEKFYLVKVTDTQCALKAVANGKYVMADINENEGGVLKAESTKVQAWECFLLNAVNASGDDENTDAGNNNENTGNTPGDSAGGTTGNLGDFRIVGYVPNWYGTGYLNNIDYSQVTHLIYAFAIPTSDGKIMALNDGGFMTELVRKAHENNVKVSIAIGGWSYNNVPLESTFAEATNTNEKCKTLADAMLAVVDQYDLDGIDVDWEYPRTNTSWQYETLIQYLRDGLDARGEDMFLTAAVAGTTVEGYSQAALSNLDWINIMAYDGDAGAGHSPYSYAVNSTNTWKNAGVPKDKLVVGVPFYERPNWASYQSIVAADKANAYKDSTTMNGTTVYYNGLDTIGEKTKFACENAGGVMIWEMSQDYTADKNLSLLNKIYVTAVENLGDTESTVPETKPVTSNAEVTLDMNQAYQKNGSFAPASNGAYADYKLDVQTAGTYTITYYVKGQGEGAAYANAISLYKGQPGTNNVNATADSTVSIPGLWTTDAVTITRTVELEAGEQIVRIGSNAEGFTLSKAVITKEQPQGVQIAVGENITLDASDVSVVEGNYVAVNGVLEYTSAGDSFGYHVNMAKSGEYELSVDYAVATATNVAFKVEAVGENQILDLGTIEAPATGAWTDYSQTEKLKIDLPAGEYVLRLTILNDGANIRTTQLVLNTEKEVDWSKDEQGTETKPGEGDESGTETKPGEGDESGTETKPGEGDESGTETKPGEGDESGTETKPGEGDESGTETKPGEGDESGTETKPGEGDESGTETKPGEGDESGTETKPGEGDESGTETKPGEGDESGTETKPGEGDESGTETKPGEGDESGTETKPGEGDESGTETKPGEGDESGTETKPGEGDESGTETKPGEGNGSGSETKPGTGTNSGEDDKTENGGSTGTPVTPGTDASTNKDTTSDKNTAGAGTGSNTSTENGNGETDNTVVIGQTFVLGKFKYKITGTNTVELVSSTKKNLSSITILATVKYAGKVYKVTSIGKNAFKNHKALKKVTIGKNVAKIGAKAFYGCKKLKTIQMKSSKLTSVGKNAFRSIRKDAVIKVPAKKYKKYKAMMKKAKLSSSVKVKK